MSKYIFLSAIALLAACSTPAERSAQMQREVDQMIQLYGPACDKLGYKQNTDPWRDCVLQLNTKDGLDRYYTRPSVTNCFGHRGFFQCTSF